MAWFFFIISCCEFLIGKKKYCSHHFKLNTLRLFHCNRIKKKSLFMSLYQCSVFVLYSMFCTTSLAFSWLKIKREISVLKEKPCCVTAEVWFCSCFPSCSQAWWSLTPKPAFHQTRKKLITLVKNNMQLKTTIKVNGSTSTWCKATNQMCPRRVVSWPSPKFTLFVYFFKSYASKTCRSQQLRLNRQENQH